MGEGGAAGLGIIPKKTVFFTAFLIVIVYCDVYLFCKFACFEIDEFAESTVNSSFSFSCIISCCTFYRARAAIASNSSNYCPQNDKGPACVRGWNKLKVFPTAETFYW